MKMKLKLVVFLGISLLLLIVFATFLLPSEGQVTDSITIYAPASTVTSKLTHYKSYPEWFPWMKKKHADVVFKKDGNGQIEAMVFHGNTKEGRGVGIFKIRNIEGDSIIHYGLHFEDMPDFYGVFLVKGNEEETVLAWKLKIDAGWEPWWRFYASMMSKITKPALTNGLTEFKKVCESKNVK